MSGASLQQKIYGGSKNTQTIMRKLGSYNKAVKRMGVYNGAPRKLGVYTGISGGGKGEMEIKPLH